MVLLSAPGTSKQRWYMTKVLPCMGISVLLLGIFMLVAAIVVLVIEIDHTAVSTVPFHSAAIVLLVAGFLSIIAGSFEVFVTKCRKDVTIEGVNKDSFKFMCVVLLAAIFTFVAAILGFVFSGQVGNRMEADMTIQLKQYGLTRSYESLANINRIQSKGKCCGVINYVDWRNTTYGGHRYDKVPDSCCIEENHACGFGFELSKINHRGCLKIVKSSTVRHLTFIGVAGILIWLIEVVLAIAVHVIRRKHLN